MLTSPPIARSIPRRGLVVALILALLAGGAATAATAEDEARIELTTYATIYGAGLGVFTAIELDLNPRPAAWLSAGLAGGALYGTWQLAQAYDVGPDEAALVTSAAAWTMVDTLLLAAALDWYESEAIWLMFGAGALAAGGALATAASSDATAGDLALMNSGGLWVPIGGLIALATLDGLDGDNFAVVTLGLNLAGLAGGLALAKNTAPSRAQALYLDAGVLLGGVSGGLVGIIGGVLSDSAEVFGLITVGGMIAGGVISAQLVGLSGDRTPEVEPGAATLTAAPAPRRSVTWITPLWSGAW